MPTLITPKTRFMHVPKTGGTWVTQALQRAGVPTEGLWRASPAHSLGHTGLVETQDFADRFTFAFVRHPLGWWRSFWGHRMRLGWQPDHFIDEHACSTNFDEFISQVIENLGGHLTERFSWYIGSHEDPISFIGRYESLADDLVRALRAAGEAYDEKALLAQPAVNVGDYRRFPARYDPELARRLADAEHEVIERFYPEDPLPERMLRPATAATQESTSTWRTAPRRWRARRDLRRHVAAFPRWHYEIDLGGVTTPLDDPVNANRHRQRERHLFPPLLAHLGGDLRQRRVLDLGCNAGFWSLRALEAQCDFVLGVDARKMHIEQAELVLRQCGVDPHRYALVEGDVTQLDLRRWGSFDVALCLGLLYHVAQPVELIDRIAGAGVSTMVIDTSLSLRSGSALELRHDDLADARNAAHRPLVMWPTHEAVVDLAAAAGFQTRALAPEMTDWTGCEDYRRGERRAFLCWRDD